MGLGSQPDERKIERINYLVDSFLFPHIGGTEKDRIKKAYFLGNMVRKLLLLKCEEIKEDDKKFECVFLQKLNLITFLNHYSYLTREQNTGLKYYSSKDKGSRYVIHLEPLLFCYLD